MRLFLLYSQLHYRHITNGVPASYLDTLSDRTIIRIEKIFLDWLEGAYRIVRNSRSTSLFLVPLTLSLALYPLEALAYVDPAMISTLYQGLIVLIMGGMSLIIFRPLSWLKKFFSKKKSDGDELEEAEEDVDP